MEFLIFLLVLWVFVLTPLLAIVAFLRTRRLREIERTLARLEATVRRQAPLTTQQPAAQRPGAPQPATPAHAPRQQARPDLTPLEPFVARPPAPPAPPAPQPAPQPASAPADTPPPLEPISPHRSEPRRIDWERWVGVRGAAVVGGVAFAIAGLLFFKHAFERGWITPEMRVAVGAVVGLAAIAVSELLRPRGYRFAPQSLAAAGVVTLYASTWAAHRLYALVSFAGAFPITAAITVGCAWLAIRQRSLIVAVIGLVGGFMTPLVLETEIPSATRLFGYTLLLDLGLVALARRMRQPLLTLLGVAGTLLLEFAWVQQHLAPDGLWIVLLSLGLFALLFAFSGARGADSRRGESFATQAAAILLPFLFVVHFAMHAELGEELWPLALLAALLSAAACVVAVARRAPWLAQGGALAAAALPVVWALTPPMARPLAGGPAWELALSLIGIALVVQLAVHFAQRGREPLRAGPIPAAPVLAAAGALVGLCVVMMRPLEGPNAPWLVGLAGLAALCYGQARWVGPWLLRPCATLGAALGLAILLRANEVWDEPGRALAIGAMWLAPALLLVLVARFEPDSPRSELRLGSWIAALTFALTGLVSGGRLPALLEANAVPALGVTLSLAAVAGLATNGTRCGLGYLATVAATCYALAAWIANDLVHELLYDAPTTGEVSALWIGLAGTFGLAAWPALFRRWNATKAMAWRAAAFAPVVMFGPLQTLGRERIGADVDRVLPLACALALGIVTAAIVRWRSEQQAELGTRRVALVYFGAVGLAFLGLALPLAVGRYEATVSLALIGLAWSALWRRIDHLGLKYWALCALTASAFLALASAALPRRFPSSTTVIWSWTSFGVLLPTAALFAAAWLFRGPEVERARASEERWYRRGRPALSATLALFGALTLFAWINLAILDAFESGEHIRVVWERAPARDLTQSIAWVVYALVLLAIGMARRSVGVRWLSLVFLLLALGKVFVHDLGELEGLYRVVSFLGLGVSLIVVSLAYQRFVFGREPEPTTPDATDAVARLERP